MNVNCIMYSLSPHTSKNDVLITLTCSRSFSLLISFVVSEMNFEHTHGIFTLRKYFGFVCARARRWSPLEQPMEM